MESSDLARLAERNEIRAYQSLVGIAKTAFPGRSEFSAERLGSAVAFVAPSVTTPLPFNRVIGLGLWEEASEPLIDEASALYERQASSFALEVGPHAQPTELVAWLRARRMRRATTMAIHVRRAERLDMPLDAIRVERAGSDRRGIVAEICCTTLGMPGVVRDLISASVGAPDWRHWLAYEGDTPIATAISYVNGDGAWLGWAATRPAFRGHGAHAALVAARVSEAAASGCSFVSTETAVSTEERPDPSFRRFERMGFRVASERATYVAARVSARSQVGRPPSGSKGT